MVVAGIGGDHGAARGAHRAHAERSQAGAGLFDGQPARLHVHGAGRRRRRGRSGHASPATAGMFHLFTHAFFKALLFLAAGSVMHAMGDVIDMRRFGGLRRALPITHWTFLCGAAALAGVPLLSGFWSKDDILAVLCDGGARCAARHVLSARSACVAMLTALLTAFYTFRAYFMTFWGEERFPEEAGHHPHEAPPVMAWPLRILAVCALRASASSFGPTHLFADYLHHTPGLRGGRAARLALGHHDR